MRKPEPRIAGKHHRDRQIEDDIKYRPDEYPVRVYWTQ